MILDDNAHAGSSRITAKRGNRVVLSDSEDDGSSSNDGGRKKRRVVAETQDDDDANEEGSDEDEDSDLDDLRSTQGDMNGDRKGKGRANGHVNGNGNGHGEDEEEDDLEEGADGDANGQLAFRPEYDRDPKDKFVAGAITRIKCKGFMTYDLVEFRPGPHLNMILGPNGTGKSTIAAAIAIGLGFPPKVMGRANDLKAYVKQGTERAETEIELKGKRGKRNLIIKRCFQRENDSSEWFMNGSPSTLRAVRDAVVGMGIQANNLCSFLPQDKVAEFAKMAPVTVLRETMRAAGDPRLSSWHEELCTKGETVKELSDALEKDMRKRDNLQAMVDQVAPQVESYQAREAQEKKRDVLGVLMHVAEGHALMAKGKEIRKRREEARTRRTALKNRQKPFAALRNHHQTIGNDLDQDMKGISARLSKFPEDSKTCQDKVRKANSQREKVDETLGSLREKIKRRERMRNEHLKKKAQAQAILDLPSDEIKDELRAKQMEKRRVDAQKDEAIIQVGKLSEEHTVASEEMRHRLNNIATKSSQLEKMSSGEKRREQMARDMDGSIAYVLDWMEKEEMNFERKVHKPPMISVNMRDPKLAAQVEACTSLAQRKTFLCETEADYRKMMQLTNGVQYPARFASNGNRLPAGEVRINVQMVDPTDEAALNPQRPAAPEQLQRLGFEGWAIDFVEADNAVIAFLNLNCGLHRAAVTRHRSGQIDSNQVAKAGITVWTTADDSNRAVRSRYGRRDVQISSVPLPPARAFHLSVDTEAVKKITEEIGQMKRESIEAEGPNKAKKEKLDEAQERLKALKKELTTVDEEVKAIQAKLTKFRMAASDIARADDAIARIDAEPSREEERDRLREEKMQAVKKLYDPIKKLADKWDEELKALEKQSGLQVRSFQAAANLTAILSKVNEDTAEERAAEEEYEATKREYEENSNTYKQCVETVKRGLALLPPDLAAEVHERREGAAVENIRAELQDVISDLEISAEVHPSVVNNYNRNKAELDGYLAAVAKKEKDLGIVKRQVEKTLDMFNPALDALVADVSSKFGAAFERVGCSGEVKISRNGENYATWGIHILVSYRNDQAMQLLTGTLQSGGERSLATVTYLMSLSEMARTPFSLVDEINQGMDQRAERAVHNQLVEVTCASDAGQYFLITPKLLTGLRYHENMKVLIINNGTWLPDTANKAQRFGDMLGCLQKHQRVLAAA